MNLPHSSLFLRKVAQRNVRPNISTKVEHMELITTSSFEYLAIQSCGSICVVISFTMRPKSSSTNDLEISSQFFFESATTCALKFPTAPLSFPKFVRL